MRKGPHFFRGLAQLSAPRLFAQSGAAQDVGKVVAPCAHLELNNNKAVADQVKKSVLCFAEQNLTLYAYIARAYWKVYLEMEMAIQCL